MIELDAFGEIGVALMQEGRLIAYLNKALNGNNLLLSTYEKELLAWVIYA